MKQDSQKDTIKDQVKDSKIVFVMSKYIFLSNLRRWPLSRQN